MITDLQQHPSYKQVCYQYGTYKKLPQNQTVIKESPNQKFRKKNIFPDLKSPEIQIKRKQRMLTQNKNSPARTLKKFRKSELAREMKQREKLSNQEFKDEIQKPKKQRHTKSIKQTQISNYVQNYLKQYNKIQKKKQKFINMLKSAKAIQIKNSSKSIKTIQSIIMNRKTQSNVYQATIPEQKITINEKFSKQSDIQQKNTQIEVRAIQSRVIQLQILNINYRQKIQKYQQTIKLKDQIIQKYQHNFQTLKSYTTNQQVLKLKQEFIDAQYRNIKYTKQYENLLKVINQMNLVNHNNEKQIQILVKQRVTLEHEIDKYCKDLQEINENLRINVQKTQILNSQLQHQKYMLKQQKSQRIRLANQRFNLISRINLLQKQFTEKIVKDSTLIQKINRLIKTVEQLDQKIEKNIDQIFTNLENINCDNLSKFQIKKLYDEKIQYINHIYKENLIACQQLNTELTIQLQIFLSQFRLFQINQHKLRQTQNLFKIKSQKYQSQIEIVKKFYQQFNDEIYKTAFQYTKCIDCVKLLQIIQNSYQHIKRITSQ